MGTCKYFAPEIVRTGVKNKVIHGMKTDLWAAGITLYELATGVHPFPAKCQMTYKEMVLENEIDYSSFKTEVTDSNSSKFSQASQERLLVKFL